MVQDRLAGGKGFALSPPPKSIQLNFVLEKKTVRETFPLQTHLSFIKVSCQLL